MADEARLYKLKMTERALEKRACAVEEAEKGRRNKAKRETSRQKFTDWSIVPGRGPDARLRAKEDKS